MPRARIPNASFIASAELPFLPFLAPRVFTESPLSRRSNRSNGKSRRAQEEKADFKKHKLELEENNAEPSSKVLYDTPRISLRCRDGSTTGGLLKTTPSRHAPGRIGFSPASIERRYADISLFAHQSIRSYRTVRTSPCGAAPRREIAVRKTPDILAARKSSALNQRGPRLAARREQALAVQRARLANHIAHELDNTRSSLMKQGQYRSLRRRILNLEHWDDTQVNLHGQQGGKRNRFVMTQALAALDRSLYPAIGQHTRKIEVKHDPMCVRLSAKIFSSAAKQDLEQTWEKWMELDAKTRQSVYKRLLVYLLDRKPARAMQFIQVLASDRLLRNRKAEVLADALGYLAKIHSRGVYDARHGWSTDKRAVKRKFISDFVHVFHQVLAVRPKVCSQDLLYNLVNVAEAKDLQKVLRCLLDNRTYIGFDTALHYANTFAKAGDVPSALRCLEELKAMNNSTSWEAVSGRERLRWTCALILRKSMSMSQEYHETPAIVATIVRLGIKMDILLYNVVMHNAMEARDYATAFKVYNTLESNGLKADKHTYSILLHGCTLQNNLAMFSQFAEHCADVAEEIRDPWLATDYLYYLYLRRNDYSDKAQTSALLQQAYLRFFSAKPLDLFKSRVRRTLSATSSTELASTDAPRFEPPPMALYIMYQAHIQEALTGSTHQILDLYERFKYLVQQGIDPALTRLANDATIWNALLLAFCQKQQFASASQLIKDMTEGSPQPNIYTWNIFMQAFFKTGQVQAAERVFEILRSRGVNPDQFTYGVLLRGYAKAQHVDRIGEAMQHLDADQEMEPDLLRALAGITQRNKLMLILEKNRLHKELQAQETARLEAEEEKIRWTAPQLGFETPSRDNPDTVDSVEPADLKDISGSATYREAEVPDEAPVQSLDSKTTLTPDAAVESESAHNREPTEALASVDEQQMPARQDPKMEYEPVVELKPSIEQGSIIDTKTAVEPEPDTKPESVVEPEPHDQSLSVIRTKRIVKAKPSKVRSAIKHSQPTPQAKPENALDPDVQYRKLQEQLGISAPVSTSSDTYSASELSTSFGAELGYKSMVSSTISKKLPEFTVRKMYQSNKQRGEE